jgi:transporter, betaine/carnitine/choline family
LNKGEDMNIKRIDLTTTLVPFIIVIALCLFFMVFPTESSDILHKIRFFLGDTLGSYYLIIGLFMLITSFYMAFSKYGNIRLGNLDKPEFSNFQWGSMMFTAGLAADILFYSLCEWILYANESHIENMGGIQKFASTYPLFHWGPIPWSFYITLAVAFGFMLHVRKKTKQKYSESLRPLIGDKVDGVIGKIIDLTAVFALIAGTATTFSLATPLLAYSISKVTHIPQSNALTITILLIVCIIYTLCAYFGIKGVSRLAASCTYLFFALLIYVFIGGGEGRYIIETGLSAIGTMTNNFISLSTWTDPLRDNSFPQNWTIFYWAYWMVWCVATPFFIGSISRGRTIRQVVTGGYVFGLSGTFMSFIILGNYGMALQMKGKLDLLSIYTASGDLYKTIISTVETLPLANIGLVLLALTMITFYATTFDSLTLVACAYSYKTLGVDEEPDKKIKLFWSIILICLPIALIFSDNSMTNLQTVSIIAAFPVGFIMVMIVMSFFKDARRYLSEGK